MKSMDSRYFPWLLVGLTLLAAFLHILMPLPILDELSPAGQLVILAGFLAAALVWAAYSERVYRRREQAELEQRAVAAEQRAETALNRLNSIFCLSQKYVEAGGESEVTGMMLKLAVEQVGASGASYVPLDDHGQPLSAINHGELPFPVITDWVEYLATPAVRDRCRTCEKHGTLNADRTCPLLIGPYSDAIGLYCLPLRRGEHEFGVLNLFMPNADGLDHETQAFLSALIDQTALALEGVRLRDRELSALRQLQAVREKKDFKILLQSLLKDLRDTLSADFALLVLQEQGEQERCRIVEGKLPAHTQPFLEGVLHGVTASAEPVLLGEVVGDPGVRSLMAAPLLDSNRNPLGALLVGTRRGESMHPRQLSLLQTVAWQMAQVVQNSNLMAELEYKVMLQERTRLAREIHDGLAQTLGFLKLQTAQMQNYLVRNDLERLSQSAALCYSTLSEAYQDVRQAIDGLRIAPDEDGLFNWLSQSISEFSEMSGIPVTLDEISVTTPLPPEVHIQLIRIVQEALSNVRKHAQANSVHVSCRELEGDLWLEICDDGRGFAPEDVPGASQHGLRGMYERSELIGADFQVVSRDQQGTTIRVQLPLTGLRHPAD